jgi:cobalt-zinc-cadmium efflux system outer membrane protein
MPFSRSLQIVFLLAGAATACAGSLSLSVESAAGHALKHNPTLAAARLRIEEARGRLQQSGRLSNPELELDFTRDTRGQEGSAGIALTQRFPLTARLRFEKAVSRAELAAAEAEVRDAERKQTADVRTAAVKLLALKGQRELRNQQLGNSQELSRFLLKRVETGEASGVDASQVELESRQIEVEDFQLAADEAVLLGELRPLLGLSGDDRLAITGELPTPKRLPSGADLDQRPDVQAAQSRAEAARAGVQEQRARRWEDFGVGASYTRDRQLDEPEPLETDQIVGFRFSLPLPLWNNNAGRIRAAEATAARAEQEVTATKLGADAEVSAARSAMDAYAKLIAELDDKVLPAATRIEGQLRENYATGQTALTEVLRARTRRLELQRQRLNALRDYQLALIRHRAATATTPLSSAFSK